MKKLDSAPGPWKTGQRKGKLSDHFIIGPKIGDKGHFGYCIEVTEKSTGQVMACKIIQKSAFVNNGGLEQFRVEASVMARMHHPNVVQYYDYMEDDDYIYLLMEVCSGGELFHQVKSFGPYCERTAAYLVRQILSAVHHLHRQDIVHCDIKPENILLKSSPERLRNSSSTSTSTSTSTSSSTPLSVPALTPTSSESSPGLPWQPGTIKLVDYGLAKFVRKGKFFSQFCGTTYYVAPEVLRGTYMTACDVWSVGVITFMMVYGFLPFCPTLPPGTPQREIDHAVYSLIRKGFRASIEDGYGAFFPRTMPRSPDCMDLITRMLDHDPGTRITASEAMLHPWLRAESVATCPFDPLLLSSIRRYQSSTMLKRSLISLFSRHAFSPVDIAAFRAKFDAFDRDNDGFLTAAELLSTAKDIATHLLGGRSSSSTHPRSADHDDNRNDGEDANGRSRDNAADAPFLLASPFSVSTSSTPLSTIPSSAANSESKSLVPALERAESTTVDMDADRGDREGAGAGRGRGGDGDLSPRSLRRRANRIRKAGPGGSGPTGDDDSDTDSDIDRDSNSNNVDVNEEQKGLHDAKKDSNGEGDLSSPSSRRPGNAKNARRGDGQDGVLVDQLVDPAKVAAINNAVAGAQSDQPPEMIRLRSAGSEAMVEPLQDLIGWTVEATLTRMEDVVRVLDSDGDGKLSFEEVLAAAYHGSLMAKEERLLKIFNALDRNRDGYLSVQDIESALAQCQLRLALPTQEAFSSYMDERGLVKYDRFLDLMEFVDYELSHSLATATAPLAKSHTPSSLFRAPSRPLGSPRRDEEGDEKEDGQQQQQQEEGKDNGGGVEAAGAEVEENGDLNGRMTNNSNPNSDSSSSSSSSSSSLSSSSAAAPSSSSTVFTTSTRFGHPTSIPIRTAAAGIIAGAGTMGSTNSLSPYPASSGRVVGSSVALPATHLFARPSHLGVPASKVIPIGGHVGQRGAGGATGSAGSAWGTSKLNNNVNNNTNGKSPFASASIMPTPSASSLSSLGTLPSVGVVAAAYTATNAHAKDGGAQSKASVPGMDDEQV